jgi:hypothetical protein
MPEMTAQRRYVGLVDDPHHGEPCDCDWSTPGFTAEELRHRTLPTPDQGRYGLATTDPLGRDEEDHDDQ